MGRLQLFQLIRIFDSEVLAVVVTEVAHQLDGLLSADLFILRNLLRQLDRFEGLFGLLAADRLDAFGLAGCEIVVNREAEWPDLVELLWGEKDRGVFRHLKLGG